MSRVQLALRVADLEGSVAFYSKLFGAEPAKRRPGYANFAIAEPPLKLVLIEGEPGEPTRMDHLGVEVETTDEVTAATARLAAEGLVTATEEDTACCYAVQDKVSGYRSRQRALGGVRRQGRRRRPRQGRRLRLLCPGRRGGRHRAARCCSLLLTAGGRPPATPPSPAVPAAASPGDCRRHAPPGSVLLDCGLSLDGEAERAEPPTGEVNQRPSRL